MSTKSLKYYHTTKSYHEAVNKLRSFFLSKGFLEIDTQSRRSILAACEDPTTISTFHFGGEKWPLPQTGQMWLEYELLKDPSLPGVFCSTTSYRDEPNPIHGRHLTIFPMFEFESHGDVTALQKMCEELLEYLGFGTRDLFREGDYDFLCDYYKTDTVEATQEEKVWKDFGPVFFLKNFPLRSNPFWNMKKNDKRFSKIDALLFGMESIGAAERSCNPDEMYEVFHAQSNGMYAALLYEHFGKERVEKELQEYLSNDFFPRFGAGIGVNRLIRALALAESQDTQGITTQVETTPPQVSM